MESLIEYLKIIIFNFSSGIPSVKPNIKALWAHQTVLHFVLSSPLEPKLFFSFLFSSPLSLNPYRNQAFFLSTQLT
jgi:hypothetical protein